MRGASLVQYIVPYSAGGQLSAVNFTCHDLVPQSTASDQRYGRGHVKIYQVPPLFTSGFELLARGNLYLTDEITLGDVFGGA